MITIDVQNPRYNIESASVDYRSMDVSMVSLSLLRPDNCTKFPWVYMEVIRVMDKGRVLLEGLCMDPVVTEYYWQVEIKDYWHYLEDTPYLGATPSKITTTPGRPSLHRNLLSAKVMVLPYASRDTGLVEQTGLSLTMLDILQAAQSVHIFPADLDVRVSARDMVPFVATSATYASVLRGIQAWAPHSVSWFDYSPVEQALLSGDPAAIDSARPVFRIADPATLPVIDLPVSLVDLTSVSIRARHDLVPPVVAVIGTDVDSTFGQVRVNSIMPPGGNLQLPGNVVVQMDAGSLPESIAMPSEPDDEDKPKPVPKRQRSYNVPRMVVRGAALPRDRDDCVKFWTRHVPELGKIPGLIFSAPRITRSPATGNEGAAYSDRALDYELVEGAISPKCKTIRWSRVEFAQVISYPGVGCPPQYAAMFPEVKDSGQRWGQHTMSELVTTGSRSRAYNCGGDYEESDPDLEPPEDPDDPPPGDITVQQSTRYDGAVTSYYQATRIVPYDGQFELRDRRTDIGIGVRVNILGDNPEWVDMGALVQGVSLDMLTGTQSVTIGPPSHLEVDKASQKTNTLQQQYNKTKAETADAPNGEHTSSYDYEFQDKEDKDKPEQPSIGPGGKYIPPAATPPANGDFAVRAISADGVTGYQVHSGRFLSAATGQEYQCGLTEWTSCGDGEVWANLEVESSGIPNKASFSSMRQLHRPWSPIFKGDIVDVINTLPGYYSYRVATITNGQILQHISAPIPIVYYHYTFAF